MVRWIDRRGRKPSYSAEDVSRVLGLLGEGRTPSAVSKELGLSRHSIYRIKEDPSAAFAAVQAWTV